MTIDTILKSAMHAHGITALNPMQHAALEGWSQQGDLVLYSHTGSGKTLAFTVPLALNLSTCMAINPQAVVITPSRELAQQVGEVIRSLAQGFKVICVYGGHRVEDERHSLNPAPAILVGTPGRILDHLKRGNIYLHSVRFLVIDEFDKCLEVGFEDDMKQLLQPMRLLEKRMFTSATFIESWPSFIKLKSPVVLNLLGPGHNNLSQRISIKLAECSETEKADALRRLILSLPATQQSVVFVNLRETVEPLCRFLCAHHISAGGYHGQMQQFDREKAIALFANGSIRVLVATDLAARGLDFENVTHIIHYDMPLTAEVFIHRNGRTARIQKYGEVIILKSTDEKLPQFIQFHQSYTISHKPPYNSLEACMATIYIKAGKKEKISKADILGFIVNNSHLQAAQVGQIVVKEHYALVAIPCNQVQNVLTSLAPNKIKGKKVPMSITGIKPGIK